MQLVQADRYLEKRKKDPKLAVDEKWDDAVKSLLNYPEVVKSMSADLDWTTALGEAVVADQGEVLQAIQAFRRKTQAAGNLKTDAKQVVVVEKERWQVTADRDMHVGLDFAISSDDRAVFIQIGEKF